jgi:hypothetical protein
MRRLCEDPGAPQHATPRLSAPYRITVADGRSTEDLVSTAGYGYAHSCVTSENFPARQLGGARDREVVLLEFAAPLASHQAIAAAERLGLGRPTYEDALSFGATHPDVQRECPVVFLHDPWFGISGRRDVICLWSNLGRRELGLEGFDEQWTSGHRFAFIRGEVG